MKIRSMGSEGHAARATGTISPSMDEEFIQPYKVCMVKLFGPESIYYHNREGLARSLMLMPPCQARVTIAQEMVTEGRVS